MRKFVQGSLARILSNDRHKSFFDKENPSLVVVGSMGLDVDGMVIAEAKKKPGGQPCNKSKLGSDGHKGLSHR